jgi:DNA-binding NtrC family response regulator
MNDYIMIVDDEISIVSMLEDVMKLAGYKCRGFFNPEEALKAFMKEPQTYKVLITDLTMPGLKGDDFAAAVHKANPECMIILSTGYHSEGLDEKLKNFILLQKPYQIESLLTLIERKFP